MVRVRGLVMGSIFGQTRSWACGMVPTSGQARLYGPCAQGRTQNAPGTVGMGRSSEWEHPEDLNGAGAVSARKARAVTALVLFPGGPPSRRLRRGRGRGVGRGGEGGASARHAHTHTQASERVSHTHSLAQLAS